MEDYKSGNYDLSDVIKTYNFIKGSVNDVAEREMMEDEAIASLDEFFVNVEIDSDDENKEEEYVESVSNTNGNNNNEQAETTTFNLLEKQLEEELDELEDEIFKDFFD